MGIVSTQPSDKGPALLAETFYIERALQPFSQIHKASVSQLLKSNVSVMVIPDSEPVSADEKADLDRWIRRGGIALRFAGPVLAASERDSFTPVPLRARPDPGRYVDWSVPARLAAFPEVPVLWADGTGRCQNYTTGISTAVSIYRPTHGQSDRWHAAYDG